MRTFATTFTAILLGSASTLFSDCLPPVRAWTVMVGGTGEDRGTNIACDPQGNIYSLVASTGTYDGIPNKGNQDALLTKFSPNGERLWSRLVWGTGGYDLVCGIVVRGGHIFLAGNQSGDGKPKVSIAKWTTNGVKVWDLEPNPATASNDAARGIAVGDDGSLYVVGSSDGNYVGGLNAGGSDCFISKYTADGTPVWHRLFGSAGSDRLTSCSIGPDGNLYVLGDSTAPFWGQYGGGGSDMLLMKWSPQGNCLWSRRFGGPADETAWFYGNLLACGPSGLFVVGNTTGDMDEQGARGGMDAFCSKWLYDGSLEWTKVVGSDSNDYSMGVAADSHGNAFMYCETWGSVEGQLNSSSNEADLVLTKFSGDGTKQWTRMWGTTESDWSIGSICASGSGSLFTLGYTKGSFPGFTNAGLRNIHVTRWNDPDADNDRMADQWEHAVIGDMSYDGDADDDNDGFITRDEFIADTNPLDGKSFMRITAITNAPFPTLYYPRSAQRVYMLERRTDLATGDWTPVPGQTNVIGTSAWLCDPEPPSGRSFYRVKVRLP
jgi:hypothetical protein